MPFPLLLPDIIPGGSTTESPPVVPSLEPGQLYDIAIGGVGLLYANDDNRPNIWETVSPEKDRIDQALNAGEQTLSNWWLRSQQSFHGGAGQVYFEQAFPTQFDQIRYALSKNVDPFTPGRVSRLPDTAVLTETPADFLVAVVLADGSDALVYVHDDGDISLLTDLDTTPDSADFSGISDPVLALATDGRTVYAATATDVHLLDPNDLSADTVLGSYTSATDPVLGWVKSRLMLGVAGSVFELDLTLTDVTLDPSADELRYTHPAVGFHWRCFGTSPTAIVAAGDVGGRSTITQFNLAVQSSGGAPTLEVAGDIGEMPIGERVISLLGTQGSFLAIGTTKGVRIGTFDTYIGTLNYGPLALLPTDPVIPAVALGARDRFVYAAGLAYDEAGLIRLDLGTQVAQDGRFAWAPDLIAPVASSDAVTALAALSDGRFVFSVPDQGIVLEGVGAGIVREAWIRTSKIRYDTTEPKLFKFGRLRGEFASGTAKVIASTPSGTTPLISVGFTVNDPPEFRLPAGLFEWLSLEIDLDGAATVLTSYQIKALPGTRKPYHRQVIALVYDRVTTRGGQTIPDALSARAKLESLKSYDQTGDEVVFQEFTPAGIISTRVIIERMTFSQTSPVSATSDVGGIATILLRTVES